ncbi:MAG: ATP-binding cassette domain-containing protein [Candidatus Obscuribacterales bacterium]|nr:ATP-binding cassette domain-containing protein [Candidatus Obscuribacterales bacterium]
MSAESLVTVKELVKNYGQTQAVKNLNFSINQGELFGLIGPDGAGKTTTFHILGGIMNATSGEVLALGRKPRDVRLEIGYLTQQFSLYQDLSIDENLRYVAGIREVPAGEFEARSVKYLRAMDLLRFRDRLAGKLSGGMKQKLALCCALMASPKILLLDEPTTGVDPVSRREFWDLLSTVVGDGVSVAVATPYLDEAERCNRLILMHEGEIQEMGSVPELKAGLHMKRLEVRGGRLQALQTRLWAAPGSTEKIQDIQAFGDRLDVLTAEPEAAKALINSVAAEMEPVDEKSESPAAGTVSIEVQEPTLENVFVNRLKGKVHVDTETRYPQVARPPRTGNEEAIAARSIFKIFGDFKAVNNVSLSVKYGEIYGLLGANGAGKTTTIKMLCGLIKPTKGDMVLCGAKSNLRSPILRQRLGYMSQKFTLYDDLTILENLEFYCGVYQVKDRLRDERINWVLANSGLKGQESMLTGRLPGGWKQRLAFGAAVMHQPEVLFLDEPTSGVDPLARREMWRMIREFACEGTAVLVTTHFLEEAEHCSQLGFMVAGELVAEGSPSGIKESQPGQLLEMRFSDVGAAYELLSNTLDSWRVSVFADSLHIVVDDPDTELSKIISVTKNAGIEVVEARPLPFSLEDSFISIVKRASNGDAKVSAA